MNRVIFHSNAPWAPTGYGQQTALFAPKLAEHYDPTDRIAAMSYLANRQAQGEVVTGLLYVDPRATDLHEGLETVETPLNQLTDAQLIPGSAVLAKLNASLR